MIILHIIILGMLSYKPWLIKRYIEKKVSLLLLCNDYVSIFTDGTSVSTFLCT